MRWQWLLDRWIAERVGDGALDHARDGYDVACESFFHRNALKTAETKNFGDTAAFNHLAISAKHFEGLVRLDGTGSDAARNDTAEIGVGFQNRANEAERAFLGHRRSGVLHDEVEHRRKVGLRTFWRGCHPAILG